MTNNIQQSPYLREQRKFPSDDPKELSAQVDQSYVDIARNVNSRTIGIYALGKQIVTGEKWYLEGQEGQAQKQQTLRQVYNFSTSGNVPHGLAFSNIFQFTKPSGSFTDGSNYYGAIYASNTAIPGEVSFYVDPVNIVILSGAGAPSIKTGTIILEWLSKY